MTRKRAHSGFIIMIESKDCLKSNDGGTKLLPWLQITKPAQIPLCYLGRQMMMMMGFLTVWSSSLLLSATIKICVTIGGTKSANNINPILSDHLMIICKQKCEEISRWCLQL